MRFMMLMIPKGYETATPGTLPDAKAVAEMSKYNESLSKAGSCSLSMGSTPRRWALASPSRAGSPPSPMGRSVRPRRSSAASG